MLITQIAFRPDSKHGKVFNEILANVQIDLSTTMYAVDNLSTSFASNVGTDDVVVHSGALHLTSADTGPAGGPKAFDIVIPLTTPFLYDPSRGNLLMDIHNFSGEATVFFDADNSTADGVSRVFTNIDGSVTDTTANAADSVGLVTQFTSTIVPEPGCLWMLSCGGITLLRRRRYLL